MKKFASLLLTAALLAAMLTVFAVPASAEEEKTAAEYMSEAAQLENAGQYGLAADAYYYAASLYRDTNVPSAADAYMKAGECYEKKKRFSDAGNAFADAAALYRQDIHDYLSAANTYIKAGECFEKQGEVAAIVSAFDAAASSYMGAGEFSSALNLYIKIGEIFEKNKDYPSAGDAFAGAAKAAQEKANELLNRSTGSTLSEGSLTIIVGVACSVVFLAVGFFIGTKKKKKPALADGTDNTDEE